MSLDALARESADALHEAARHTGAEERLDALVRSSRRRTATRLGAAAVAVALAVSAAVLLPLGGDSTPAPAGPGDAGSIIIDLSGKDAGAGTLSLDVADESEVLAELDGGHLVNPFDMDVSPDGSLLALTDTRRLQLVDLESRRLVADVACTCLFVGFRIDEQLYVDEQRRNGLVTVVYDEHGTRLGTTTLAEGTWVDGLSPGQDRIAGVEQVVGDGKGDRVFVQDSQGGGRFVLRDTRTDPGSHLSSVTWAPRGDLVAYLQTRLVEGDGGEIMTFRLMVASTDTGEVHEVADLGACSCVRETPPTFAWSPDGRRLAAVRLEHRNSADSAEAVLLDLDGTVVRELSGRSAPSRRPVLRGWRRDRDGAVHGGGGLRGVLPRPAPGAGGPGARPRGA